MGLLSISEMINVVRKHILQLLALSMAVGLLTGYLVSSGQTYTCTLGFKYTHEEAQQGLAPDGISKLDPYEIQNPVVIGAALNNMGIAANDNDVKGIRQKISVSKVITELDKEVSESAALLGEKYDVTATEYEMKFSYSASLGDDFGSRMFSNIIKEYDKYLLNKYYNKRTIEDFAKIVAGSDADYIVIADSMNVSLTNITSYLDTLASSYPDFRSVKTGYSFAEISALYQNLANIEYAKFYGNIRAGNLAKDRDMVIKGYQAKVKAQQEIWDVNYNISENYKKEMDTFYDSYKKAGLYRQAERVQTNVDSTNNRDQDVLDDFNIDKHKNTYDSIVLNYAERAVNASDASHTIDYYKSIIFSFENDNVSQDVKNRLLSKNEDIFKDISILSAEYSVIANDTIGELFNAKVNTDLQYLILPEVTADSSVGFIAGFLAVLTFGGAAVFLLIAEVIKKLMKKDENKSDSSSKKLQIDTSDMDELHQLLYEQYLNDFDEFFMVYQKMVSSDPASPAHSEAFIRWNSPKMGMVSPGKILDIISDFGIFNELNDWIIKTICHDLRQLKAVGEEMPIVHVNCPYEQLSDLALENILFSHLQKFEIPAENICLELEGEDIVQCLEDIILLEDLGINICIDKFENSSEEQEIISVVKPAYIKLSLDILNTDIYATSEEDIEQSYEETKKYLKKLLDKCRESNVKACICGIENKEQHAMLTNLGFDYMQGYYYAKPERLDI